MIPKLHVFITVSIHNDHFGAFFVNEELYCSFNIY